LSKELKEMRECLGQEEEISIFTMFPTHLMNSKAARVGGLKLGRDVRGAMG
jgi:hypothetical protein